MGNEKLGKTIFWLAVALAIGGFLVWAYLQFSKPLPGEAVADMGRNHVPAGTQVAYNSNPPTSGPHYAEWTRAGIYDVAPDDRNLVHSLEHGYVIISYNCKQLAVNSEQGCLDFKIDLAVLINSLQLSKLIVTPRENLDVPLALTAWTRILKLQSVDETLIRDFVGVFRNAGPEQTVE